MISEIRAGWRQLPVRLRDRRFWMVQALVLLVAIVHTGMEVNGAIHHERELYLLPISTYFVPVLYAALSFGVEGAVPTALWCVLLTAPNIYLFHHGQERIGVSVQLALLVLMGSVVAAKVDRERQVKLAAQAANRRLAETQHSLRAYIGMALRAQERERHRLARELHDETIQDLALIKMALHEVPSGPAGGTRLASIDQALQRSIDGIRRFCRALRPSVLDDLGLEPSLEWLLAELAARCPVRTALRVHGEPLRLEPEAELALFRIAQEALRNVERHAAAALVAVRLEYEHGGVRLEILDDGHGFDPATAATGSLGVTGMRERARLIGGTLQITSRAGATRVVLYLPRSPEPVPTLPAGDAGGSAAAASEPRR